MRKKSEMQKANEEFVKTYDDSKYPKPSVTADIVIFGMFDKEEDNYRKIAEKELKVLLIQRGAAPYEGCYSLAPSLTLAITGTPVNLSIIFSLSSCIAPPE